MAAGLVIVLALAWPAALPAQRQFPADARHTGMVQLGPYTVFPENRPDNGVYLNNRLLLSLPRQTIIQILPLPAEGRFAYLARAEDGKVQFGASVLPADAPPRIVAVSPGFYHAVLTLGGVVYKKLYRVVQERSIVDLLPISRTADGMTAGPKGVAFYHVATAEDKGPAGQSVKTFGIGLHLMLFAEDQVRHLNHGVVNTLPRLDLKWLDDQRLEYKLADGRGEVLSVAQFQ
ncbi:MAG: hypothetical protein HY423_08160 [Candidatus Lambdaproteobacteria bacterium]|nr:hypothetical protein [Candidatus Lambdaproteobacteria bacterium]